MSPKPKTITVKLSNPQPKKHVVRYDAVDDDAALTSLYVRKADLAGIGTPDDITVTITAA